ncbi:MAG TPA: hypothetical protein V6C58_11735 [Allocoleopsis sp.]
MVEILIYKLGQLIKFIKKTIYPREKLGDRAGKSLINMTEKRRSPRQLA